MWKQLLIILLLLIPIVQGATLEGTVYDLGLEPQDKAIVSVDTQPKQQVVATEGKYVLEIPPGDYLLKAVSGELKAEEKISIVDDGEYVLDLFLFEDLSSDQELLENVELDMDATEAGATNGTNFILIIVIIVLALLLVGAGVWIWKSKKEKKEEIKQPEEVKEFLTDDAEKVLNIIKKHSGHTTQKAIRKELGVSEAKVSLIIADLEDQGKIRKIKKGRANVIVINESV